MSCKSVFVFLLFLSLKFGLNAQLPAWTAGFETGGQVIIPADRAMGTIPRFWSIRTVPFVQFRIKNNWYLGAQYEDQRAALEGEPLESLHGFGLHSRYYLQPNFKPALKDRLQLFGELTFQKLNYVSDPDAPFGFQKLDGFTNHQLQLTAGGAVRLLGSFYLNYGLRPLYYFEEKRFRLSNRLVLEYHFGEQRPQLPKKPKPAATERPREAPLQLSYFLKRATIGSSYTFLFDRHNGVRYQEKTWNINVALSITNDLDLGLSTLMIRAREGYDAWQDHLLAGAFLQYDLLRNFRDNRLFLETGYFRGNVCTCGDENPYKEPNLSYISYGAGADIRISQHLPLYLDLSFLWYQLINDQIDDTWALSQYVIGLNYRFYRS